ncbi:MAG TPA: tyrosine-protein phosphatase [Streptosporangiaceae bacterium]|nr:tyrosine-protein phosphatase [Streptosporangiaceae bacterium]
MADAYGPDKISTDKTGADALADDIAVLIRDLARDGGPRIPVEGTLNFRDVGGYPVDGGGAIRRRTLYRSDALHKVEAAGSDMLAGLDLRTVVDLRTIEELLIAQSPLADFADRGTRTIHLSLVGPDFSELPPELDGVYSFFVDRRGQAIAAAIKHLTSPGALPGLVHCTAGKDRTGVVIAFTLAAVGVPDQVIAADYALSSMYLVAEQTAVIGQISAASGLDEQLMQTLMASPPELMTRTLARAREQAGSITGYLRSNGLTDADLAALRTALVEAE